MTIERADWLVSNNVLERREGSLARQKTTKHEQVNRLARHHDGRAGKRVQEGERITTVDGITEEELCLLFVGFCPGEVWSGD